jgi:hypothetical protein
MRKLKKTPLTFSSWDDLAPLKDAFDRIMPSVGAPDLAALRLYGDLRNRLGFVVMYLAPDKKHMVTWLTPSDSEKWRHVRALAGDVLEPPVNGYPFTGRVDLDNLYPIPATPMMTAAPQSDDIRPPERRRGRPLKHEWIAIAGEIAARCINPKTRLLEMPKSERGLARDMLGWCQETYRPEPAESEMREAVRQSVELRAYK